MLAVKAIYSNGHITLENRIPVKSAEVIVVFPDMDEQDKEMDLKNRRKLFEEFSGSVDRIIDERAEKMEAVSEERFCGMLSS